MKILRMLRGSAFRPRYVRLVADVPRGAREELEQQFGCQVHCHDNANAIGFDACVFDWPVQTSNRLIYALIESHFRTICAGSRPNLVERV